MKRLIIFMLALLGCTFAGCEPQDWAPAPAYAPLPAEYSEKPLAEQTLAEESNVDTQEQE